MKSLDLKPVGLALVILLSSTFSTRADIPDPPRDQDFPIPECSNEWDDLQWAEGYMLLQCAYGEATGNLEECAVAATYRTEARVKYLECRNG